MIFLYSLKLLSSNWGKALKFFLYYIVVWGLCFALFLPCFFQFRGIISANFSGLGTFFQGVFGGHLGEGLNAIINTSYNTIVDVFKNNIGLAIYGLLLIFVVLPYLVNVGKYAFCEMLYSYMTSKAEIGFFSALVRSLRKSLLFSLCKVVFNIFFLTAVLLCLFGIGQVFGTMFVTYILPFVAIILLVVMFSLEQTLVLGWLPAMIVFDCNVFCAFRKGIKAVKRHFWTTLGTAVLYFVLFWVLTLLVGFYCLAVLIPIVTILLNVYNMAMFFSSQGMRFYYTENNILTPKKLEEVDNINKTAYIL